MTGAQKLWQAVTLKAFTDATAERPASQDDRRAKESADKWIRSAGRDFQTVCSLAGMDARFLSDAYRAGRVDPDLLRAAAAQTTA